MTANVVTEAQPTNEIRETVDALIRIDRASKRMDARRKELSARLIELGGTGAKYTTSTTPVSVDSGTKNSLDVEGLKTKYPERYEATQLIKAQSVKLTISDASEKFTMEELREFITVETAPARITIRYKQVKDVQGGEQ